MQASAELIVGRGRGSRSVVMRMFAEAPLLLRQTSADDDPDLCVHLVGGAAGRSAGIACTHTWRSLTTRRW